MDHKDLRELFEQGITGKGSHLNPDVAFEGLDWRTAGTDNPINPYTLYQIANHMHFWMRLKIDLFQGRNVEVPDHDWYTPEKAPASESAWSTLQKNWTEDLARMLVLSQTTDLAKRYPQWKNRTAAELIMMMIMHNSYHTAQFIAIRRAMGVWK